jgi:hypothetical protein
VKKPKKSPPVFYRQLARFGCIATGVVYATLGVFALLSLLRLKHGGADEASLLKFFEDVQLGKVVISIILAGMIAYMIWRFYEAINDPYQYGREGKGILIRLLTAFSAISDGLIAWPAIESLIGMNPASKTGDPVAQRQSIGELIEHPLGVWVVSVIGIITLVTAVVQFIYVFKEAYKERIDFQKLSPITKTILHILSYAGHIARGIILGIIAFFLLKAGLAKNGQYVVNTDKAFDFIGDNIGKGVFAVVAAGTICYGFFMMAMGYYYDFRKGK